MQLPEPSAREVRWTFYVAAAAALLLTATLCWGIVHRVNQSDDIVHIAASNADTVERLNDQIDVLNAQLDAQGKAAERRQARLQQQNRDLKRQLDVLLAFLRDHGLQVPSVAAPKSSGDSGGGGGGHEPPKRPAVVVPERPGNSGAHANPHAAQPARPHSR